MTVNRDVSSVSALLDELESELKALSLWGGPENMPDAKAFADPEPFCLNSMEFHEWLEYVLVARFRQIIAAGAPLPEKMCVHTFAQEKYRGRWGEFRRLIGILQRLDKQVSI